MTFQSEEQESKTPQMKMNVVRIEETRTELEELINQLNSNASNVKEVNLRRRTLSQQDMIDLCQALINNTHVIGVSLLSNDIDNEQAKVLAAMLLKNKSIKWLSLARNHLDDNGVIAVLEAMKSNGTVQVLNLSYQTLKQGEEGEEQGASSSSSSSSSSEEEKEEEEDVVVVPGITDASISVMNNVLKFHNRTLTGINIRGHLGITTKGVDELITTLSTYNDIVDVYIDNDNENVSASTRVKLAGLVSDEGKEGRKEQVRQFQQQLEVQKALQGEKEALKKKDQDGEESDKMEKKNNKLALLIQYGDKKVRMDATGMTNVQQVKEGIQTKLGLDQVDQVGQVLYVDVEFDEEVVLDQDGLDVLIGLGKGKLIVTEE